MVTEECPSVGYAYHTNPRNRKKHLMLGSSSSLLAFWLSAHMHTIYIIYNIIFQLYTGKKSLPLMFGQVTSPYQQHMNCYQTLIIYTSIYQYIIFGPLDGLANPSKHQRG